MTIRSMLLTILNIISTTIGILIGSHILFGILGVAGSVPIIQWVNSASESLTAPFKGIFSNIILGDESYIDINAIIALVIYSLIFSVIYRLLSRITDPEVVEERRVVV